MGGWASERTSGGDGRHEPDENSFPPLTKRQKLKSHIAQATQRRPDRYQRQRGAAAQKVSAADHMHPSATHFFAAACAAARLRYFLPESGSPQRNCLFRKPPPFFGTRA